MKNTIKILAMLLIALLTVPAFAQVNAQAESETNANVENDISAESETSASAEIRPSEIRWRQFRENMQDFVYSVRTKFVFSEESRVELIQDRNEQLRARQEAWVEYKNSILNSSTNVSADVKAAIKAKHEAIIREHVELTHEINRIKAEARAEGNTRLEMKANETMRFDDRLKFGLGKDFIVFLANTEEYKQMDIMTESEIRAKVEAMGYEVVSAELDHESGISIWHIIATRTHDLGSATIRSDVEINFEAKTGLLLSIRGTNYIDGSANVSRAEIRENLKDRMEDVEEIRKKIREYEAEIEIESETETESGSNSGSGSASSGSNANANASASANANGSGASASASTSVGVGL